MDLISILFDAAGGALGVGIGFLISQRFSKHFPGKNAKAISIVVPAVLFLSLSNSLSTNQHIRDIISPPSRIEKLSRTATKVLTDNPKFKNAVSRMTQEQTHPYIQQLSRQGIKRLSFQELKTWNELRIALAKNSSSICAGFWTGAINSQELMANIDKLNDRDLESWVTISMTAAVLELEQKSYTSPPDSAFEDGLKLIASKLQPEEIDKMSKTMTKGANANNNDACWTMLKLLEGVELLPPQQQEIFLRSLASQ
jgi:hypothetical protein